MIKQAIRSLSLIVLTTLSLSSCNDKFHEFRSTNGEWSHSDTLQFCYPDASDCKESHYEARIEIRCTADYKYKDLWLRIEANSPQYSVPYTDTLHCNIFDDSGRHKGATAGTMYQLDFPIAPVPAACNDTIEISIIHIMNDKVLKGISDVGIKLSRPYRHLFSEN